MVQKQQCVSRKSSSCTTRLGYLYNLVSRSAWRDRLPVVYHELTAGQAKACAKSHEACQTGMFGILLAAVEESRRGAGGGFGAGDCASHLPIAAWPCARASTKRASSRASQEDGEHSPDAATMKPSEGHLPLISGCSLPTECGLRTARRPSAVTTSFRRRPQPAASRINSSRLDRIAIRMEDFRQNIDKLKQERREANLIPLEIKTVEASVRADFEPEDRP